MVIGSTASSVPYPGAYVKYAFELFGKTFEPFSCSVLNPEIKEVVFEQAESGSIDNAIFWMTFNFGPVSSLDEALRISDLLKNELLNKLSFQLDVKVEKARLIEHNVIPRPGEGAYVNIILPALQVEATIRSEPCKVLLTEITNIQNIIRNKTSAKQNTQLKLYRHALNIDDIVAQFFMLYLILDIMTAKNGRSDQGEVDNLILLFDPSTPLSSHPSKKKKDETIFSKLRNEMIHREVDHQDAPVDHEGTRNQMTCWIDKFRKIVKAAILKNM